MTIRRDGLAYTTAYTYTDEPQANGAPSYFHYHNPTLIRETGPTGLSRDTRLQYQHYPVDFDGAYITTQLSHQEIQVGSETVVVGTWDHDHVSGFVEDVTQNGVHVTLQQDALGNLQSQSLEGHTTTYEHQWGQVSAVIPPIANTRLDSTFYPDGRIMNQRRQSPAGEVRITYGYDSVGRPSRVEHDGLTPVTISYPTSATVQTTQGAFSTTATLDGFGRTTHVETSDGVRVDTTFDREGRLIVDGVPHTTEDASTHLTYDALGRVTTREHVGPSGSAGTVTYTYSGDRITIRDEANRTTVQQYEAFGSPDAARLASVTDADGKLWRYSYDAAGHLTKVIAPDNTQRTWTYVNNRLASQTQPESGTTAYFYDDRGNLFTTTDATGQISTYHYDDNERLVRVEAGTHVTTLTYEIGSNNPALVSTAEGIVTAFAYDAGGRLTTREDRLDGRTFTSQYFYEQPGSDALTRIRYPSGRDVTYTHNSAGQVTSVADGATVIAHDFLYHPLGMVTRYTTEGGVTHQTTYDPSRFWVTSLAAGPLTIAYTDRDDVGNVRAIDQTRGAEVQHRTFTYDVLDRLKTATNPTQWAASYDYDVHGNRVTNAAGTYVYDAVTLRLQQMNAEVFQYNGVGALTQTTNPAATYTYDPAGQLQQATVAGVATGYRYTGDGWRIGKTTNGSVSSYHLRGPGGELLTEITNVGGTPQLTDYLYAAGRLIAVVRKTF